MSEKSTKSASVGESEAKGGLSVKISLLVYLIALASIILGKFDKFVSYFVAIVLHEIAHAAVANRLGYRLGEFRLMPYGAALIGVFDGASPRDERKIAVAGPLLNVVLAIVFAAVWWLVPAMQYFTEDFVLANVTIAATNVLPVYPLDGGRLALAFASEKTPRERAYKKLRIIGFIVGAVFAAAFVLSLFYGLNPTFATMSAFMLFSAFVPDKHCAYKRLYGLAYRAEKSKKGLPLRTVVIAANAPARSLLRSLNCEYYTEFRVVDGAFETVAVITETELERIDGKSLSGTVEEVARLALKKRAEIKK